MKFIPNKVATKVARQSLKMQKASPQILFVGGIVGVGVGTVLACRATLKVDDILTEAENSKINAQSIHAYVNGEAYEGDKVYGDDELAHDERLIVVQTGVKLVKAYAPAVVVLGVSVAALTKSHNILNQRNAGLAAAYAALDKGFNEYRARVVDKFGEETDRELRHGYETVILTETGEDGKKHKTESRVMTGMPSIYARFFDELSSSFQREPEYNLVFLRCQQDTANDLLRVRGHLFLNEVYDMLGIERSLAGQVVGWVKGNGDNYVDFGIFSGTTGSIDFVNGREGAILLDFNVDGDILSLIDEFPENN